MAGVGLSFGQSVIGYNPGIINFQNTETTKAPGVTTHLVTNSDNTLLVGTQYKAELYYVDSTTSSLVPFAATISSFKSTTALTLKGTWNGPANPLVMPAGYGGIDLADDGAGGFVEAGDGSGTGPGYYPVPMVVRVWDSTFGATWEAATGHNGQSPQFLYTQRYSNPAATSDAQMIAQKGFAIVPEPSAIALSIIGVAGLLLIRRRK